MAKATIDSMKCLRCKDCAAAKACPAKAIIRLDYDEPMSVEVTYCYGCGVCLHRCIAWAITTKEI